MGKLFCLGAILNFALRQHVHQRRCRLPGQAVVLHMPQPGGPRDRKGTLEITPKLTLGIQRLQTGRTSGRGLRRRHQGHHKGAPPGHTNRPGQLASSQGGSGTASTTLGGVSAPALTSPGEAPSAGLPALDIAPTPPAGLSALDREPPLEFPGPEHSCRHPLGLGF